jgi:hypothetical protein
MGHSFSLFLKCGDFVVTAYLAKSEDFAHRIFAAKRTGRTRIWRLALISAANFRAAGE